MATIVVLGAGMNGLALAMLLAKDGHDVTVLERDANEPVDDPEEAWNGWVRRGVGQFRMLHLMLPRWRSEIEAELPEVLTELERRGGLRLNALTCLPDEFTGGFRPGDERFETVNARRPVLEGAVATVAHRTPGVRIRRGVAVSGLNANGTGIPQRNWCRHRARRDNRRRPRRRHQRAPLLVAGVAGHDWCPAANRGTRGLRVRVLRAPLPLA